LCNNKIKTFLEEISFKSSINGIGIHGKLNLMFGGSFRDPALLEILHHPKTIITY